jgi:hypothetical protein
MWRYSIRADNIGIGTPNFSFLLEKEKKSLIKRKEKFLLNGVTTKVSSSEKPYADGQQLKLSR